MGEREFYITPKTTCDWLDLRERFSDSSTRNQIVNDMVTNAQEVEGGADWDYILNTTVRVWRISSGETSSG